MSRPKPELPGPARDYLKPSGVTLKTQLRQVEKRNRILRLTRAGATAAEIVEILARGDAENGIAPEHVTVGQVKRLVKKHIEELHFEDARTVDELRAVEVERLDAVLKVLYPRATRQDPDLKAIDRFLRLSERRAKLLGLDHAIKVQHDLGPEVLRDIGADPERIQEGEEAFKHTFGDFGVPDPVSPPADESESFEGALAALPAASDDAG